MKKWFVIVAMLLLGACSEEFSEPEYEDSESTDQGTDTESVEDSESTDTESVEDSSSETEDTSTSTDTETSEDTSTEEVVLNCVEGDISITNSLEIATLKDYNCINGNLTIEGSGLTSVLLPNLLKVGEVLINNNVSIIEVDLSGATEATFIVISNNAVLKSIDVSSLESTESFSIDSNPELTDIDAAKLTEVTGWLRIANTNILQCDALDITDRISGYQSICVANNKSDNCITICR